MRGWGRRSSAAPLRQRLRDLADLVHETTVPQPVCAGVFLREVRAQQRVRIGITVRLGDEPEQIKRGQGQAFRRKPRRHHQTEFPLCQKCCLKSRVGCVLRHHPQIHITV